MNWPKILTREHVEPLSLEERGALLTGIIAISEGIPIKKTQNKYLDVLLDSVRLEAETSERNSRNGKRGGNPALINEQVANAKATQKPKRETPKVVSSDLEQEISAYTPNEQLRQAIREFVDYRKQSGKAMTHHAFDLMLKKLAAISSSDTEQIEILNTSIVGGYQGIFPLRKGKQDQKVYGPNGVKILPESEQLHDLDHLF